jgi:hypothetical protein
VHGSFVGVVNNAQRRVDGINKCLNGFREMSDICVSMVSYDALSIN